MLQLKNTTPFAASMALLPDEQGIEAIYVNVRGSFRIGPQWILAEEQPPPTTADVYWGDPASSSLKLASDYHTGKSSTDVVMIGNACAPDMRSVRELDVALSVANRIKTVRVFGDRVWDQRRISAPGPFENMPLLYERAFGGCWEGRKEGADEPPIADERNPVGLGYAGGRDHNAMEGQPLPNLEDPHSLIRSIDDEPEPACFGFRAAHWHPRALLAGTYDEAWQRERMPYLPLDFDKRFLNCAHPDLICDSFLRGGEPIEITGMRPEGKLQFNLPRVLLRGRVIGPGIPSDIFGFNLETVLLQPNDLEVSMVWKAKIRCDKNTLKVGSINVTLHR